MTRFLICSTLLHFPPQSLIASVSHLGAENLTEAAQFPPATASIYIAVNYVCSDMISNKGEKIKQELAALCIDSGCLPSSPSNIVGDKKCWKKTITLSIHSLVRAECIWLVEDILDAHPITCLISSKRFC